MPEHADLWFLTSDSGTIGHRFVERLTPDTPDKVYDLQRILDGGRSYWLASDLHDDDKCEYPTGAFVPLVVVPVTEDPEPEPPMCLAVDMTNVNVTRTTYILCNKPKGHDGDHGNERFTWPTDPEGETP